jgi:hypothetical protein
MKVVVRFDPFHRTTEPLTKSLPLTVNVKLGPPAVVLEGLRLVIPGTGLLIVKVSVLEVPPPAPGLNAATDAVPAVAISAAVIDALSRFAFMKVVNRSDPFHRTTEVGIKFDPLTVRLKPAPPAVALDGLRLVRTGTPDLIVKVNALEVPPPGVGLNTVTDADPTAAMSAAVMEAVNWLALM